MRGSGGLWLYLSLGLNMLLLALVMRAHVPRTTVITSTANPAETMLFPEPRFTDSPVGKVWKPPSSYQPAVGSPSEQTPAAPKQEPAEPARAAPKAKQSFLADYLPQQDPSFPSPPAFEPVSPHRFPRRILITGAAGFVGFHTALKLRKEYPDVFVTGLDNDAPSYPYAHVLKPGRRAELSKQGVDVVTGDLCDMNLLRAMFKAHNYTHVIHLAARPGVRASMLEPFEFVRSNVRCTVVLLEVVKAGYRHTKVAWASSSSVYGGNKVQPFSELHRVDNQYSLYGATKKSDEMITHTYYHMYGINCVGLRFFTVYGPWGRPDMAYFAFALAIAQNKTITVTKGDIKRDFTYVDDIAEGVVRATLRPTAAYDIFNLGNGRPEKLIDLVHLVEQGMGRKAEKKWRDIPPGDVPATFANVSHAHDVLGYASTTNLDVGISKFMKWFNSPVNPILPLLRAGSQHTATA